MYRRVRNVGFRQRYAPFVAQIENGGLDNEVSSGFAGSFHGIGRVCKD